MTEELTAEERALLPISENFPDGRAVAKLLRCYDICRALLERIGTEEKLGLGSAEVNILANQVMGYRSERDAALARAEALQKLNKQNADVESRTQSHLQGELRKAECYRVAAESRLSEATALLKRYCRTYPEGGSSDLWLEKDLDAFSSATPAPAAKAEPTEDYTLGYREGCDDTARELLQGREKEDRLTAAVAALSARLGEHPDTIALRECRAELESVRTTARKLHESLTSAYEDIESARADAEQLRAGHAECRAELEAERQEVELKQAALNTVRAERDTARVNEHKSAGDARLWKLRYDDECKRSEALTSVRALVESIEAEIERDCTPRESYWEIVELVRPSKGGGS